MTVGCGICQVQGTKSSIRTHIRLDAVHLSLYSLLVALANFCSSTAKHQFLDTLDTLPPPPVLHSRDRDTYDIFSI